MVMPGDNARIEVGLDQPIALEAGSRFAIREGGRPSAPVASWMWLSNSSRGRDRSAPALLRHQPSTRMSQTTNATTTPIATISTASWRPRDGGATTGIPKTTLAPHWGQSVAIVVPGGHVRSNGGNRTT